MKKNLLILVLSAFFVVNFVGCGGYRRAAILQSPSGIIHEDANVSLLQFSIGPQELANAKATLMKAEDQKRLYEALVAQIKSQASIESTTTNNATTNYKIGIIVNEDPLKTAWIYHPEMSIVLPINPKGGWEVIAVKEVPKEITVLFAGEKQNKRRKIWEKEKIFNGIKTNFGSRIQSF